MNRHTHEPELWAHLLFSFRCYLQLNAWDPAKGLSPKTPQRIRYRQKTTAGITSQIRSLLSSTYPHNFCSSSIVFHIFFANLLITGIKLQDTKANISNYIQSAKTTGSRWKSSPTRNYKLYQEHELTTRWGEWAHVIQNLGTEHKGKHHEES